MSQTDRGSTEVGGSASSSRRYLPALLAGALGGTLLGLWAGHEASRPAWGALGALIPIGVALIVVLGLLVLAGAKRTGLPVAAALALVAAAWIAAQVAPGAPGSRQTARGTGSVGTVETPDAVWSGPVTCMWYQGEGPIYEVQGFDAPGLVVGDSHPGDCRIDAIAPFGYEGPLAFCSDGGMLFLSDSAALVLEDVSGDGRSGTATLVGGGWLEPVDPDVYVFTWACAGGP